MPSSGSPTVRRRRLAAELRRLRDNRKAGEIARAIGWSPSKISRAESGRDSLPPEEIEKLIDYYGVAEPLRGLLLALAEDDVQRGWWEDQQHENGNYQNTCVPCGRDFIGHKRRVVCKACSTGLTQALRTAPAPQDASSDNPRVAALMDSQYVAGAKAGFNAAQMDDPSKALADLIASRDGYIKVLKETRSSSQNAELLAMIDEALKQYKEMDAEHSRCGFPGGPGTIMYREMDAAINQLAAFRACLLRQVKP